MSSDVNDDKNRKQGQGHHASGTSLAKLVINNAVKHCDYHNKAIEEQQMWRRRREQQQKKSHKEEHRDRAGKRKHVEGSRRRHYDDKHEPRRSSSSNHAEKLRKRHASNASRSSDLDSNSKAAVNSVDRKSSTASPTAELEREYYNELRRRKRAALLADASAGADNLLTMPRSSTLKDNLWRNV